ncbi:MAG TPA: PEP-CTERM sorting domain-containing protein [Phycisphaerae bacterium]|nr:PEP-CTERM sorting domain-containing protein [Phycisphaerae bacterium]
MKVWIMALIGMLVGASVAVVQALPVNVPDFASDPSGPAFTIEAIGPTEGASQNIATAPTLTYGITDPETGTPNTLQMNWHPVNPDEPAQAGWRLKFGMDPDVRNQQLTLSINPPGVNNPQNWPAITQMEVRITDINGLSAGGWGFNTDQMGLIALGNDPLAAGMAPIMPGPPPLWPPPWASLANNSMQVVTINIGNGPVAGSAVIMGGPLGNLIGPNYLIAGNGGNLAQAASLDFYENGILRGSQAIPVNGPPGINNYWDHVFLTPEPASMALLALAGGVALARRRR